MKQIETFVDPRKSTADDFVQKKVSQTWSKTPK